MNNICKTAALGLVAGALALSTGAAQAQDAMTPPPPPAPGMMPPAPGMMAPTMTPMPVSGTVLRYYVDRAGFVSAMDVQAADGVKMVRFSPSMAQKLTAMYPVGSQISAYVTSSTMGMMTSYDLAGMGTDMPTPATMMMPMTVTDIDILKSTPYVMLGSKAMRYSGKITGFISDPMTGTVLAVVLDKKTLIRIPANDRLPQASPAPEGVTPLAANADVVAYGYPEAPRYGSVSPFDTRVVATTLSVNGRSLGPFGFGKVMTKSKDTLFGFNLNFFGGAAPREMSTESMGYTTYTMPGDAMTPPPAPPAPAPGM